MDTGQASTKDGQGTVRKNGIFYIEVAGTPYEMGMQHGSLLRDQIVDSVGDYKANIVKLYG